MGLDPVLPIRIAQTMFSGVVIGLMSFVMDWWQGFWHEAAPPQMVLLLFSGAWSIPALGFLTIFPRRFPKYTPKVVTLTLEFLSLALWGTAFALGIMFITDRVCFGGVCDAGRAAVAFAGANTLAFFITIIISALMTKTSYKVEPEVPPPMSMLGGAPGQAPQRVATADHLPEAPTPNEDRPGHIPRGEMPQIHSFHTQVPQSHSPVPPMPDQHGGRGQSDAYSLGEIPRVHSGQISPGAGPHENPFEPGNQNPFEPGEPIPDHGETGPPIQAPHRVPTADHLPEAPTPNDQYAPAPPAPLRAGGSRNLAGGGRFYQNRAPLYP